MALDHAGHEGGAGEVDGAGTGWGRQVWADAGDAIAFDQH
jgi:hypothetical protein